MSPTQFLPYQLIGFSRSYPAESSRTDMEIQNVTPQGFEKASDKLSAEHLDRAVDEVVEDSPSPESVPETVVEVPTINENIEEEKVPKSRFLTMHQRAIEAEKALRQFEAERVSTPQAVTPVSDDEDLKKFYIETFGETEIAEKLYQNELARLNSIEEKAADRAFQRLSQMGKEQEQAIKERVESFDHAFEELGVVEGKEFSDDEQVALLEIVEEYSPKNSEGLLIAEFLLPLDRAYEIYKLKSNPIIEAKRVERNKVASLQGARSEGTPSTTSDADWQPGQDRRWWNKVK